MIDFLFLLAILLLIVVLVGVVIAVMTFGLGIVAVVFGKVSEKILGKINGWFHGEWFWRHKHLYASLFWLFFLVVVGVMMFVLFDV